MRSPLLALLLLPLLALAQDRPSGSNSNSAGPSQSGSEDAPRPTVTTFTTRSQFVSTLSNGDLSTGTSTLVVTSTIAGEEPEESSAPPSSTKPLPTAPTDIPGGGGAKGAPEPGKAGVGGAYGPDDDYIAAALGTTVSGIVAGGAAVGALLVLV